MTLTILGAGLCMVAVVLNVRAVLFYRRSLRLLQEAKRWHELASERFDDAKKFYEQTTRMLRRPPS